jgi:hypothetical protein
MITREFKALIVFDFRTKWLEIITTGVGPNTTKMWIDFASSDDFKAFSDRISGQEVVLCKYIYPSGTFDYFEKENNNYVIFEELFMELVNV